MPIQTLRPEGAGAETNLASQYPTSGEHWDKVDEATADDATTYVRHNTTSYATDTYALPAGEGAGDIDQVTVYARCYGISGSYNYAKTVIRTHGTLYQGSEHNLSANWDNLSTEYQVNPNTNQPWSWAEINALEAGAALKSSSSGSFFAICTQVYVEVSYHTETPKSSSDTGSGTDDSQPQANITAGDDTGAGEGTSGQEAILAREESGSSVEGRAFLATLVGDEPGSASEELGGRGIVLAESSQGSEASNLGADLAAGGDLGSSSEGSTGQEAAFTQVEAGSGAEGTPMSVAALIRAETGSGAGAAFLLASLLSSEETGSGLETLLNRAIASRQSGSGLDQTLARFLAASEASSGQEMTSDLWKGSEDKDMERGDSGGGTETVHDRIIFLPEQGTAIDGLLSHSLSAREGYGHALSFDGDNDYVNCGADIKPSLATFELWLKCPTQNRRGLLTDFSAGGGGFDDGRGLLIEGTNNLLYWYVADASRNRVSIQTTLTPDVWNHIVGVHDTNKIRLYVNGEEKSSTDITGFSVSSLNLYMGRCNWGWYLNGLMDEVRIYNRALSGDEISYNYNGGKGRKIPYSPEGLMAWWHMDEGAGNTIYDETENNNNGTIYGATWTDGFLYPSGIEISSLLAGLAGAESGAGTDSLLARLLTTSEAGTGIEWLLSRLLRYTDSGLGSDARLALLAASARAETGAGLDALTELMAALASAEAVSGIDRLLSREIPLFDAGSSSDIATLYKAFLAADSGAGLEALANLLALIITSEAGSGSEQLRARIVTSAAAGDMKLPATMGEIKIPSREVNL